MVTSLVSLLALTPPALPSTDHSVRVTSQLPRPRPRHPGQNGALTPDQEHVAKAAWKYFENNFQPTTCLYNSVNAYPSTTLWDTASAMGGLVAAFELGLVDTLEFDQTLSCMLDSLAKLTLVHGELPNKAYNTATLESVNYDNTPAEIGFSAIDVGRLLTWLAIVKNRYPVHSAQVDRVVLRWHFCNVVDRSGALYGAAREADGNLVYLQEGRLGYEEYAAAGFQLWGFDTTEAARMDPREKKRIHGVKILHDARDPALFGAHDYVATDPYLLSGIELNWDRADDTTASDTWMSNHDVYNQAKRVYKVQHRRWKQTGVLTARTEHHVEGPPYFVYDTIYSDGVIWNTLADDGTRYPTLAAVSTKTAIGLDILFDTPYTHELASSVMPLVDPERGLLEGYYEVDGRPIESLTANTNGVVLEALLYKVIGKLYTDAGFDSLWDHVPNGEYPGQWQCLPNAADHRLWAVDEEERSGVFEASRQRAPESADSED